MSRDNVKRVLVTTGNQAIATADSDLGALALGQIGVFDASTHKAIDATSTPSKFYVAVGVDTLGGGTKTDHAESAGQSVQANRIVSYTFRPHTAPRAQVLRLSGVTPDANVKDYAFKLEFRNQKIYRLQGVNQFTQTYAVYNEGFTQEEFMTEVVETVNANDLGFVEAALAYSTNAALTVATDSTSIEYAAGDPITVVGDIDIARTKGTLVVDVDLTSKPMNPNKATNLNLNYYQLLSTVIIGSLVEGFSSAAKLEETVEARFEEGDGAQIRQAEYHQTGLSDPYVLSDVTGTARDLHYNAVGGVKYDSIMLEYGEDSIGGFQKFLSQLQTEIAIPATDTVTRDALVTVLDAQVAAVGLDALADDAALANVDPAVIEDTEDRVEDTDGIA